MERGLTVLRRHPPPPITKSVPRTPCRSSGRERFARGGRCNTQRCGLSGSGLCSPVVCTLLWATCANTRAASRATPRRTHKGLREKQGDGNMRTWRLGSWLLVLLVVLAPRVGVTAEEPQRGGTLAWGIVAEPPT